MYLEHFGLGVNPFSLSPKLDFLFKSGTFEESMAHLVYGLDNHEAIVLITGAIGTGKTMALQSFLTSLGPRFEFALITNTRVTAIELLKLILEDLGVGLPVEADKSDLLILFKDYLNRASREGKMVLLVVDEAQNLEPEVLEEIRLLTNLGQGETQPVQIILVGQPELEETVNRPDLAQIRQRIRVHYNLDPLSREETEEYINHRMAVAGCGRNVFTAGAIDRIFKASHGVPRLVNTMAGEALLSAFVAGHEMVQPGDIEEDQDLRFTTGPVPVQTTPPPPPVVDKPEAAAPPPPPPPPVDNKPEVAASPPPPPPAPPPAPEPVPKPAKKAQGPGYQAPSYHVHDRRRSRGGGGKVRRSWLIGAAVVLALWALYYFGAMDGLVSAFNSSSERKMEPGRVPDTAVTLQQQKEIPVEGSVNESEGDPVAASADNPVENKVGESIQNPIDQPEKSSVVSDKEPMAMAQEIEEKIPEEVPSTPLPSPVAGQAEIQDTTTAEINAPVEDSTPAWKGDNFIHIYSFRTPERANAFIRHWANPADSLSVIVQELRGVTWHRVYLGPYLTREAALLVALRLKEKETIDYFKVVTLTVNQGS